MIDITLHTKVADLLDAYPQLEAKLFELSPIYAKLKNPVLRHTVAKVTSLQQAAGVAGISPAELIQELRKAAGLNIENTETSDAVVSEDSEVPHWFDKQKIRATLDVVPIIDAGQSPMQEILKLSTQLEQGEILELITPFKPIPIIEKLKARGFSVWIQGNTSFFIKE